MAGKSAAACAFAPGNDYFKPFYHIYRFFSIFSFIKSAKNPGQVNAPEAAIVTVLRLALVRQAGRAYAESGAIDADLLAQIGSPMIPEETYAQIVNGGVNG